MDRAEIQIQPAAGEDTILLNEKEKLQVEAFAKRIDLANEKMMNSYGSSVQNSIAAGSAVMLERLKTNDFDTVGERLNDLCTVIYNLVTPPKKGFFSFFRKQKQTASELIANYEKAEETIKAIEKDLQQYRQALTKEIYVFEQMYEQNQNLCKEVTMYLAAGKQALELAQNTKLHGKTAYKQDLQTIQLDQAYEAACIKFEKKLMDLEMSRQVCIQTTQQIRFLQKSAQEIADKLRSNVLNTIPLWRNQMALALGMEHNRQARQTQHTVNDITNEISGSNQEIIKSIMEVIKIQADISGRRMEVQKEAAN